MGAMKLRIGLITGSEISVNREGEDNVRLLQVEIDDADDVQTVEQLRGSGDDQNPQDDSAAIVAELGPAWKIALAIDDGVDPGATIEKGERRIYSYNADRVVQAFIRWLVDGTLHLNGDSDNAVRYSALETAYNQLRADHDDLVSAVNAHTHNDSLGAPTTAPLLPAPWFPVGVQPSTGDVTPARIDEILVP